MDSEPRSRRYDSDEEPRPREYKTHHKRRDRSPMSEDERRHRRRRHPRHRDDRDAAGATSDSDMNESGDEHSRRRRTNHRTDHHERRRRDRRSRSRDPSEDERKSSRQDRKYRSRSRSRDRRRDEDCSHRRKHSRSPISFKKHKSSRSTSPPPPPPAFQRSRGPLPSQDESFRGNNRPSGETPIEKQKPNLKPTGLLAKEANTVAGTTTVLKYHEPPEARKPPSSQQWRLYCFKSQDLLSTIQLHTRSAWLIGRDPSITDIHLEHPSISKQHAVIQFRHRMSTNEFGDKTSRVKPYLIDLESANGSKVNGKKVEPTRYMELLDQDVVSFGDSEREYVMMLPGAEK